MKKSELREIIKEELLEAARNDRGASPWSSTEISKMSDLEKAVRNSDSKQVVARLNNKEYDVEWVTDEDGTFVINLK